MDQRYSTDLQRGLEFQDWVQDQMLIQYAIPILNYSSIEKQVKVGENRNGIEIKYDAKFRQTGNLFIEVEERSTPTSTWHPSGPMKNDNSWAMAIGDKTTVYVLPMRFLRRLWQANRYRRVDTPTAVGFLLPVADAKQFSVFELTGEKAKFPET